RLRWVPPRNSRRGWRGARPSRTHRSDRTCSRYRARASGSLRFLGLPACGHMPGFERGKGGLLVALGERQRAARLEPAARWWVDEGRRATRDAAEALLHVPDSDLRQRRDQKLRVRVTRRVDDSLRRGLLGELARGKDQDRVSDLVQDGEVVRDHDDALD